MKKTLLTVVLSCSFAAAMMPASFAQASPAKSSPAANRPASKAASRGKKKTKKLSRSVRRKAQAAYRRGAAHQKAAEYDQAIVAYREAYALSKSPALWFNIGQAFRLWGKKQEALDHYRRYLEAKPEGRAAPEAYGQSTALAAELNVEREADERARAAQRVREAKQQAEGRRRVHLAALDKRDAKQARGARKVRRAGLITAGSGALAFAIGGMFHARAAGKADDIAAAEGAWSVELDDAVADGNAAERNAVILYAVGGTAVATGLTLYLVGHFLKPQARDATIMVTPIATATATGATLTMSF